MAVTHTLIQTITVSASSQASIEFTSIPQIYTDLLLVSSARNTSTAYAEDNMLIKFNGSTTGFSSKVLRGSGSAVVSYTFGGSGNIAGFTVGSVATASVFSNTSIYIPNYSGSTNKSFSVDSVSENNVTQAYQLFIAGLWSNTSAITSIMIYPDSSESFKQYSSASLYGIKNS